MSYIHSIRSTLTMGSRLIVAFSLGASIVGCSAGNPYVEVADRNEVITVGDSVFDSSSEIQMNLESFAGQTFRDYTLNGSQIKGVFVRTDDLEAPF